MEYMSIWRFGGKGEGHEAWAAMYIESRKAGYIEDYARCTAEEA